jgi:hypothetical protein
VSGSLTVGPDISGLPERAQLWLTKLRPRGTVELTAAAGGPLDPATADHVALRDLELEVLAVARGDFSVQPEKYPLPITHIAGAARILPTVARGENLEGYYGADRLRLAGARIPLPINNHEIRFNEIHGTVDFAGKPQGYPLALNRVFGILRPQGRCTITGNYVLRPFDVEHRYEYSLGISADHGAITPAPLRIPITDLRCDMTGAGRKGYDSVWKFIVYRGSVLGGVGAGTGQVETGFCEGGPLLDYNGAVTISGADLSQLAPYLAKGGKNALPLSGRAFLDTAFNGTGPYGGRMALDALRAKGDIEIVDGDFGEVPVLRDVLGGIDGAKDALTIGQAAGTFDIRDHVVTLDRVAISAPIFGVEGDGAIGFDGNLDLHVIAAPLADWRDKLRQTGIPVVSDAASEVAGAIQKLLNGASRALLYEFRIGGKVSRPEVMTVPAPVLTDSVAALFGQMMAPPKDRRLIDEVRQ